MDSSHADVHAAAPKDNGLAYVIFLCQGIGTLFPWNAFITAESYFATRFKETSYHDTFENYFSISQNIAQTIGLGLAIRYQHKIPQRYRVLAPLLVYSIVFLLTTILVGNTTIDPDTLFWITLLCVLLCGCCGALLSGGIFGLAGRLPPIYTQAVMSGQGFAGLIVSLASIFTTLGEKYDTDTYITDNCNADDDGSSGGGDDDSEGYDKPDKSAEIYFGVAVAILLFCVFGYFVLESLPITQYYLGIAEQQEQARNGLVDSGSRGTASNLEVGRSSSGGGSINNMDEPLLLDRERDYADDSGNGSENSRILNVFGQVKWLAYSVFMVFFVTLSLFPSITTKIESDNRCDAGDDSRLDKDLFIPFMFLLFNLFDFIGRSCAGWRQLVSPKALPAVTSLRVVFFLLFLMCNTGENGGAIWFHGDAWPFLFMIAFALTNGYLSSLAMMYGPGQVAERDMETAGTMMVFFLTLGLFGGSGFSFVSYRISQGKFPGA